MPNSVYNSNKNEHKLILAFNLKKTSYQLN